MGVWVDFAGSPSASHCRSSVVPCSRRHKLDHRVDSTRFARQAIRTDPHRATKKSFGDDLFEGFVVSVLVEQTHSPNATLQNVEIHPAGSNACCSRHPQSLAILAHVANIRPVLLNCPHRHWPNTPLSFPGDFERSLLPFAQNHLGSE